MQRFFSVVILLVLGCVIVAYSVANRTPVTFVLDPFIDEKLSPTVQGPLSYFLFGAVFLGVIVGWLTGWLGQGHWRKAARKTHKEAAIWKLEAEKLKRGLEAANPKGAQTPAPRQLKSYF
jgi:hypothetical protein